MSEVHFSPHQHKKANNYQSIIKVELAPLEIYLTKHCSLSFNTTNPPASNTQTINHSGVWVGPNYAVRIENAICVENNSAKILKIDLIFAYKEQRWNYIDRRHVQKSSTSPRAFTWCTIPEPGGTTNIFWKALEPHLRKPNLSLLRLNSSSMFACTAFGDLATSTCTEWSMTRSTGTCSPNKYAHIRKIKCCQEDG